MTVPVKFHQYVEDVNHGVHNLNTHTLKVLLTIDAPDAAADEVKADLTGELSTGNGYTAGGATVVKVSSGQSGGTYSYVSNDVVFTASGGTIGPFRYAVLYNDSPTSPADPLIGYWDKGENVTLQNGETYTVDVGSALITDV